MCGRGPGIKAVVDLESNLKKSRLVILCTTVALPQITCNTIGPKVQICTKFFSQIRLQCAARKESKQIMNDQIKVNKSYHGRVQGKL